MEEEQCYRFQIEQKDADQRMDHLLSELSEDISRNFIQRLIEKGNVSVNGKIETTKKYKVKEKDWVELRIPPPEHLEIQAEDLPLEIIYEDDDLLIVNKPKGMVVHPAPGNYTGTMVNALMYHCKNLSSINGVIRPGIVHRIDKDTSGLLMVAKNDATHSGLAEQLSVHSIRRAYLAVVYHNFPTEEGSVCAAIGRDPRNRLRMAVTERNGKNATTHYKVMERLGNFTLIEATLETGRTHQIRVHMAYIGHPLLGDPLYGPKKKAYGIEGQVLHAGTLGFVHPKTNRFMEFHADPPKEFCDILEKLRR